MSNEAGQLLVQRIDRRDGRIETVAGLDNQGIAWMEMCNLSDRIVLMINNPVRFPAEFAMDGIAASQSSDRALPVVQYDLVMIDKQTRSARRTGLIQLPWMLSFRRQEMLCDDRYLWTRAYQTYLAFSLEDASIVPPEVAGPPPTALVAAGVATWMDWTRYLPLAAAGRRCWVLETPARLYELFDDRAPRVYDLSEYETTLKIASSHGHSAAAAGDLLYLFDGKQLLRIDGTRRLVTRDIADFPTQYSTYLFATDTCVWLLNSQGRLAVFSPTLMDKTDFTLPTGSAIKPELALATGDHLYFWTSDGPYRADAAGKVVHINSWQTPADAGTNMEFLRGLFMARLLPDGRLLYRYKERLIIYHPTRDTWQTAPIEQCGEVLGTPPRTLYDFGYYFRRDQGEWRQVIDPPPFARMTSPGYRTDRYLYFTCDLGLYRVPVAKAGTVALILTP